ncbi:desmocollin-3-like [Pelobates fuscus]|uniref:desmocollin-3-like n=1 Tax=Pelobates fuscus TaxID=191477 RepID=UPI002FE42DBC
MGAIGSPGISLPHIWCFFMILLPLCAFGENCHKVTLPVPSEIIHSGSLIGKVDLHRCLNSYDYLAKSNNPKFEVFEDGSIYAKRKISLSDTKKISFAILLLDFSTMMKKKMPIKVVAKPETSKQRYTRGLLRRTKRRWQPMPAGIMENSPGPFPALVQQIQSDTQVNYTIYYSISGAGVDQPPVGLFYVEEKTGNIFVTRAVNREEIPLYTLMCYARTADGYSPETPLRFTVKVEDMNDNAPLFTEESYCMEILEHSNRGAIVGRVNATDIDEPNSLHTLLRYSLISQIPASPIMFAVDPNYGIITTTSNNLDREVADNYVLLIEVRDMGGRFASCLSSTGTVLITVTDINDYAPTFTQQSYQTEVNENESGMIILRIPVIDKDLSNSSNWRAKYSITQGNEKGYFNITTDPVTNEGLLSVVKGINYEEVQKILIQVGVTNEVSLITPSGTKTSGLSTVPVTVIVKDVDEGPEFQPAVKVIHVRENQTIGTVIGDFKAIDPETKSGNGIIYSLQDSLSWVSIDTTSGQLTTIKVLDYESNEAPNHQHNVTVYGVDQSGKTGTGTLVIIVDDVNDNMPFVPRDGTNICTTGKSYSVVEAADPDGTPYSAPFKFSLDPSVSNQWRIGQTDGNSIRLEPVTDMAIGTYDVPLHITDQQGHGKTQILKITKCICADGINCSSARSDKSVSLGGLAILLMVLSALLVAALLCALLACACGSGAGKDKIGFPDDAAQQNLIVTNTEAPGADVMDQNFKVPVHISDANVVGTAPTRSGVFGQGGQSFSESGGQQFTQSKINKQMTRGGSRFGTMGMGHSMQDPNRLTYSEWQTFMNSHIGDKLYMCGQDEEQHKGEDYVLQYNYEGKGSVAGSIGCCSELRGEEERLDFLNQLEPKFRTLAEVCAKK